MAKQHVMEKQHDMAKQHAMKITKIIGVASILIPLIVFKSSLFTHAMNPLPWILMTIPGVILCNLDKDDISPST